MQIVPDGNVTTGLSFHHRPEAQHQKSSAIHKLGRPVTHLPGSKPTFLSQSRTPRCISYCFVWSALTATRFMVI